MKQCDISSFFYTGLQWRQFKGLAFQKLGRSIFGKMDAEFFDWWLCPFETKVAMLGISKPSSLVKS